MAKKREILRDFDGVGKRLPIILCIDTSSSMKANVAELNESIKMFFNAFKEDINSLHNVEIAVIFFNTTIDIACDFAVLADATIPQIDTVSGATYMGSALKLGLKMAKEKKQFYNDNSYLYYQPWLLLFTDGYPDGGSEDKTKVENARMEEAIQDIQDMERDSKLLFYSVGIGDKLNENLMRRISIHGDERYFKALKQGDIKDTFKYLNQTEKILLDDEKTDEPTDYNSKKFDKSEIKKRDKQPLSDMSDFILKDKE